MHARNGTTLELSGVPVDILPDAAWVTTRDPQPNTLIFVSRDRQRSSGRRLGAADLVRGRVYGEAAIVPWGSP